MRRIVLFILALFLLFTNIYAEASVKVTQKEVAAIAEDGFNIKATLSYPKVKNQKEFSTVILLHSLGYNSQWWENLPEELLEKGYAVLAIDLRGHGASIYNAKLSKVSWKNLKNSGYTKYPNDVLAVIKAVEAENTKKVFFNNYAIVGADVGASTGIIASDNMKIRPKTIVMLSPVVETKGIYIPVSLAHLDGVDILSISGTDDFDSKKAEEYLKKFAQEEFATFVSDSRSTGMMMIKNDPSLSRLISEWIWEYLN